MGPESTSSRRTAPVLIAAALSLALVGVAVQLRAPSGAPRFMLAMSGAQASPAARPRAATPPPAGTPVLPAGPIRARVGIQAGHWRSEELPAEFASLREQGGARVGGASEVEITLAIAQRVAALLSARGVTVDILPATVPPGYRADAFVALHCDVNGDPSMRGYKLARFSESAIPTFDDALVATVGGRFAADTGQPRDAHVTRAMTGYYAFNSRDFAHAIDPQTPGAIVELGFLSNPLDLNLLLYQPDLVATAVADGILRYLTRAGTT